MHVAEAGASRRWAIGFPGSITVKGLVFVREPGFPRRWRAVRRLGRNPVGIIAQEHEREGGRSVFRYRAMLFPDRPLGLFATLRGAKQAVTEAIGP